MYIIKCKLYIIICKIQPTKVTLLHTSVYIMSIPGYKIDKQKVKELYQWSQSQGSNWGSTEKCTFLLECRPSITIHPMCGYSIDLKTSTQTIRANSSVQLLFALCAMSFWWFNLKPLQRLSVFTPDLLYGWSLFIFSKHLYWPSMIFFLSSAFWVTTGLTWLSAVGSMSVSVSKKPWTGNVWRRKHSFWDNR